MASIIIISYIGVGLLGLVMGSFAGAMVWRLRARQLVADKADGEAVDMKELRQLRPLVDASLKTDRSRCLHCHHELRWFDLVPLISWLSTGGTCRYCHKVIGRFEPAMEIGTSLAFLLTFHVWVSQHNVIEWPVLLFYAVVLVLLVILFAYDFKWFLLPDVVMVPLIGLAGFSAAWKIVESMTPLATFMSITGSVAILGGLYLGLWLISKGAWVGFGDVKLGLALGLLLSDWQLAFLTLFLANLIGTLVVLPGLIMKKIDRKTHVPFGPFLIAGFLIAFLYGTQIVSYYLSLSAGILAMTFML